MATLTRRPVSSVLRDADLFREACYINGRWITGRRTTPVDDPATGDIIGSVPELGRAETKQAIDAAAAALVDWRARTGKERVGGAPQVVRTRDGQPGRPRAPHDARARETARRIARRSRLRRVVHRMVRRRSQAGVRRHDPVARARQAPRRHQAADRRRRQHHAVEFSDRDDHAQSVAGARRRVHDRAEAGAADAVLRARARGARRARGAFRRASSTSSRASTRRSARELTSNPARAQDLVHRLDRGRQDPDGAVRRRPSRKCRSSSAATPRSSCSTTRTSTPPSKGRLPRNTATPGRPASARTASWCRTRSTTSSRSASSPPSRS